MKKAIIFGDSYSTFAGYVPEGYAVYYDTKNTKGSGVTDVSETWWHMVTREAELELVLNNSWSGSTIGYTGYGGYDCSGGSSFIYRLRKLKEGGFFEDNEIDVVFIFGGTNDSWSNAPLGAEMQEGWTRENLFSALPAIGYFFHRLREILPNAKICGIANCNIKPEIVSAIVNASVAVGATAVVLQNIDKIEGHPTPLGMEQIKEQVLAALCD